MSESKLRITEIFYSLQGETSTVGLPTVFVRLTGCPLRCLYCDTEYAFSGGEWMDFSSIFSEIKNYKTSFVTVTGGEPLAQPECISLLEKLCDHGYQVSLETSGAMPLEDVDPRVKKIMDIKTPDSAEVERNRWENLQCIHHEDQIKFVICSEQDYQWCKQQLETKSLDSICEVLFSPSHEQVDPAQLADWILRDQLPVRFQMQLHKVLWGNQPGK
ncbi:MAG: 7-carboxy-7-deazaguanine synthase QueE [Gammaproteobacteria bacterium]|nr:7-carboxy-7-deazaguanine synthase QueE [Gammaproteobacteria bacterium]